MIKDGYSKKIIVRYSETDQNLAMKPYALLNFLQDIASNNADEWGFGYPCLYPKNFGWFLIKYRMEFEEYPHNVDELTLITEPRGYNKLFAYREFELRKGEKLMGRMFSQWCVIDMANRTMVPVYDAVGENPHMIPHEKREDDLKFDKISPITSPSIEKEFEVRYNDLDVNGHANNGNYIVWAFEPLSFDFKNTHTMKTVDMLFKKEARYGETLISQVEFKDENTTIHRLHNKDGEDLFLLQCLWQG